MSESPKIVGTDDLPERDIVGVGFGPANLALAIAIEEHNATCAPGERISAQFFEARNRFEWHPGMLLDGATMQIAFPKDLVTFRNPRSAFTFFNYLFEQGRLVDFVNHQTFFPTRHEFNDYLKWAARHVEADVRYDTAVESVRGIRGEDGVVDRLEVRASGGARVIARNVVMGLGLRERVPEWANLSTRCFHNHQFLYRVAEMPAPVHQRFVVLGAGQSAAEIVQYLHTNYPEAEVHNVFSRYGYSPADDSPYANRIFDPQAVDDLHGAPEDERLRLLDTHRGTNYSVVDIDLINEIYATEYQERVRGHRRLFMRRASEVVAVEETSDGIDVAVHSALDGLTDSLTCDALILATGFAPAPLDPLLGDLAPEADGPYAVGRDYRLAVSPDVAAGIYMQGGTEKTHGITSSLLSNVAVRAGEIVTSVVRRRGRDGALATVKAQDTYVTSEAK
ncbi:L-lysine 6-monooxygenase [Rhodococcus sp. WMMA185]|uniref:lysine N(6)-hydroxylase/L-ornithine N(5)-oxygenase family protein n=1 Tax=Rhodococcus sp. WMMA185 TaxID=679318 RepID=UPI000878E179|nr:SidA/IucD/PvdA family monooxygenase [Rhodococcus sp. WMMA185]AOW95019.1 L-lysine 6-monooxygenase [Rhodococcus sp. WMMA185]